MLLAIAFVLHTGLVLCVCVYVSLFLLFATCYSPWWSLSSCCCCSSSLLFAFLEGTKSILQEYPAGWYRDLIKKYQKVQTTRNCMCTYERCFCWTNTSNMPGCIRFSGTVSTGGPLIGSTDAKDWYRVELIHHAFQIPCALRHWKHESEPAKLVKGTVTFKQDIAKTYENKTLYLKVLRIFHSCCILKYIDGRQWSARISRFP